MEEESPRWNQMEESQAALKSHSRKFPHRNLGAKKYYVIENGGILFNHSTQKQIMCKAKDILNRELIFNLGSKKKKKRYIEETADFHPRS